MQLTRFRVVIMLILSVTSSSLIVWHFVSATPAPSIGQVVTPGNLGPCNYFIYNNTQMVAKVLVQTVISGTTYVPGDNYVGALGIDMSTFLSPLTLAAAAQGAGAFCISPGNYTFTSTLTIKGHSIYFITPGLDFTRLAGDNNQANNPNPQPVYFVAKAAMKSILVWGDTTSGVFWHGGGITNIQVNGNALATDCIEAVNLQDFRVLNSVVENCSGFGFAANSTLAGGVSNLRVSFTTFRTQGVAIGTASGVHFGNKVGQSWIDHNYFSGLKGKAIVADSITGNQNHIQDNYLESMLQGSAGNAFDGSAIYDTESEEVISGNIFNNIQYNCIYDGGQIMINIENNACFESNSSSLADGSCIYIGSSPNNPANVTITGNTCYDDNKRTVYEINILSNGEGFLVVANQFFGYTTTNVRFGPSADAGDAVVANNIG